MNDGNGATPTAASALLRKLTAHGMLDPEDQRAIEAIQNRRRSFPPKSDILREGTGAFRTLVIRSGWVLAYKNLSDGRRQVTHFLLPGDVFGLFGGQAARVSLGALTPVEVAEVDRGVIEDHMRQSPALMAAFGWIIRREIAILQEQIVRLGRRSARERTAHLLLELYHRLRLIGMIGDNHFQLPLSQVELSDMLGLSGVHMNRTLSALRREGLIEVQRRWIRILDADRMTDVADYRGAFLNEAFDAPV